jgi:predicted phage terminase large subunit-like protein
MTHEERLANLFYFAKEELGYNALSELHLSWFDAILRHRFLILLAPPKHFKSTVCTIAYPLFRLAEDRNMRILLVNEVLENSKNFLREIKGHLQQNPKFRERHGHWDITADAWTEERILIPRTEIRKEPSIAVASVLGTVVSVHPNLIVVDDPCSNRNTQTPAQRQKVMNWFQRDLLPRLDHGGQIIVVMTRWHTEDLAGWIMTNPGYEDWKVINLAAEWTDEGGAHHVLFPDRFDKASLEKEKARLGTANYNCLYLNDPSGQEGSDFKAAWIDSGRYDRLPDNLTVFAGIDLAIGKKDNHSRFAYCVIGVDKAGDVYVIDAYRDRIPFFIQLNTVKRINRLHHPRLIVVETNAYQTVFVESLRTDPETKRLPLKNKNTTSDKHARIRGMAPLFENGAIRLPRPHIASWVGQLEEELLHFPHSKEDMLDALWLALQGVQMQRVEPKITYAEDLA